LIELTLLAVILLLSGLIRGSFTVLLLSLSYYLTCSGLPVVRETVLQNSGSNPGFHGQFLVWLSAIFPDFSKLDFKTYVIAAQALPPITELAVNFFTILAYAVLVLWLACFVYGRKDLR
jgi:hypothetical protein